MGGCCCCPSKAEPPPLSHCPRTLEQPVPLSAQRNSAPTVSTGLVVDTNLETSSIDTYRPPPTPLPYDVASGHPLPPAGSQEIVGNKNDASVQTRNSVLAEEVIGVNVLDNLTKFAELKQLDGKGQTDHVLETEKEPEIELSKSVELVILPAEECPTCLEEYDSSNPKIVTKCDHHFHLACILEWMERSDTCPVCDQEMIFCYPIN